MRSRVCALVTTGAVALGALAACTGSGGGDDAGPAPARTGGKVGVILPDTSSSQRWGTDDPKLLKAAFDAAEVPAEVKNADGDPEKFVALAEQMIAEGASVIMLANLDAESGKQVHDKAHAAGVQTIDYDRLTLNGDADYYVSFDNVEVGRLQANGLRKCLSDVKASKPVIADLNGSPTDNNAALFKEGYESILQPLYDEGVYVKGPDQSVADWDADEAATVFREMWTGTGGDIQGVLAANDGLANAAISVMADGNPSRTGPVPVTGQDATVEGLQNILAGDQCMTVYKPIKLEADAAAKLAVQLYQGETPAVDGEVKDPESGGYVPAELLKPISIFKANVADVIADDFVSRDTLCQGRFRSYCTEEGL